MQRKVNISKSARSPRLDDILPGQSHTPLCIGDTIALCMQQDDQLCFVGSEGFVELTPSLRNVDLKNAVPWTLVDCLWVVTQKHQYDAQKNIQTALQTKRRRDSAVALEQAMAQPAPPKSPAAQLLLANKTKAAKESVGSVAEALMASRSAKALAAQEEERKLHIDLLAAVKAEREANAARNAEKRGTALTYGETIQLMHVKSKKILTFNPKRRSMSVGCYSVRLNAEGSEDAWLVLRPRHSFQFEGAGVHNHDLLTLHSTKRQLFLHVGPSEKVSSLWSAGGANNQSAAMASEVNAAPSSTTFQLIILKSTPAIALLPRGLGSGGGSGGASVSAGGGVGGPSGGGVSGGGSTDANTGGGGSVGSQSGDTIKVGDIIAFYHCDEERHLVAEWSPSSKQDDVCFSTSSADGASPNSLWQVQAPTGIHFDNLKQGAGYCLQHLASGRYLSVCTLESTNFATEVRQSASAGKDGLSREEQEDKAKAAAATRAMSMMLRKDEYLQAEEREAVRGAPARRFGLFQKATKAASEDTHGPATRFEDGGASAERAAYDGTQKGLEPSPRTANGSRHAATSSADAATSRSGNDDVANQVLCVKSMGANGPDLFTLHDCHATSKELSISSIVRIKHVKTGCWVAAVRAVEEAQAVNAIKGAPPKTLVMGLVTPDCYIRDGLLIERPLSATQTFFDVAGVTRHLTQRAHEIEMSGASGSDEQPFTTACIKYLTEYIKRDREEDGEEGGGASRKSARISTAYLQDVTRELGVLAALVTMLTVPFMRLGTLAFHKLGFDKPLLPQSKRAATLLFHCIENNARNCQAIYTAVPSLEPAARKPIGIGEVLQQVFAEVPAETPQIEFWLEMLAKARKGTTSDGPDLSGGAMVLSLLYVFCFNQRQPMTSNQNLIALKLILSPASDIIERIHVVEPGLIVNASSHDEDMPEPSATDHLADDDTRLVDVTTSPQEGALVDASQQDVASKFAATREHLRPLRRLSVEEEEELPALDMNEPEEMAREVLMRPALLCVVMRKAKRLDSTGKVSSVLCLSPCKPEQRRIEGTWTPLVMLREKPALLAYYLKELKLLGGLCFGHNGLTLRTLRTLYPFGLCIEIIEDTAVPSEVRAAVCVLTRQFYIESASRVARQEARFVWDWDALRDGPASAKVPPINACLSMPQESEPASSSGAANDGDGIVSEQEMARLEEFVSAFVAKSAVSCMTSNLDLELLCGVLDVCTHLLRNGYLQDPAVIERIFEKIVAALAVPQHRPIQTSETVDEQATRSFKLTLDSQALICNLLEAILEYRLRMRCGAVLRRLAADKRRPPTSTKKLASRFGQTFRDLAFAPAANWQRLDESSDVDDPSAGAPSGLLKEELSNVFEELRRGATVMAWKEASDDMIRALMRTATKARGIKPELVADALRVLFAQFNQSNRLATTVANAVLVRGQPEREEAIHIGVLVRRICRAVMDLKAIASTDPLPTTASMLSNLAGLIRELGSLCATRHQRQLHCALGSHEAVISAIRVLLHVEEAEGATETLLVDGMYRLPPQELLALREEAFDFLANFCGGPRGSSIGVQSAPLMAEAPSTPVDDTFCSRRNSYGRQEWEVKDEKEQEPSGKGSFLKSAYGATTNPRDSAREPANQEALFAHFDLILAHMSRVRRATSCARCILEGNAATCGAVSDAQLDKIINLMVEGSARYSWYMDVLLSLARGLPNLNSTLPLNIIHRLLEAPNGYLLVLYSGAAGREKRARELASLSEAQRLSDTGMVAFHHGLVQLLAELCAGLANEVEMHVQSAVPLHEVCSHICDAFCPYAIRASFFYLLMEAYTVTALKVGSLIHSPAVWQVVAIFVSELRSVLECIAGHGDEDDRAQALLAIHESGRGPSFVEAGLWFLVGFVTKHVERETLRDDHKTCLANVQHLCTRLLTIERARTRAARERGGFGGTSLGTGGGGGSGGGGARASPRDVSDSPRSRFLSPLATRASSRGKRILAAMAEPSSPLTSEHGGEGDHNGVHSEDSGEDTALAADFKHPRERRKLSMSAEQLTLLATLVHSLKEKGIGAGSSTWRNMGLSYGLSSVGKAVASELSAPVGQKTPSEGMSAHAAKRRAAFVDHRHGAKHKDLDVARRFSANQLMREGDEDDADGGDGARRLIPAHSILEALGDVDLDAENEGERLHVDEDDNGLDLACKISRAVEAASAKLKAWEADEFHRSVLIVKEAKDAIRPIIDQLKSLSSSGEDHAMHERCLRVLQALLRADTSLQEQLNDMGVTSVMVRTLGTPTTPRIFDAALELGIALLDGGNTHVQKTIFKELSTAGSNDALAALSHALNAECAKIYMFFEQRSCLMWYEGVLAPHVRDAVAAKHPLRKKETQWYDRIRGGGALARGSLEALAVAVQNAEQAAGGDSAAPVSAPASASDDDSASDASAKKSSSVDTDLASKVLLFMESVCEGHYADMQDFLRVQSSMRTQVNLVIDLVNNLIVIERTISSLTISLACQLYQTLTELVQGPCPGNQRFLIGTNLCDVAVRFMHGTYADCNVEDKIELKQLCLKLLLAMVEGIQDDLIPRRIASSLDYNQLVVELDDSFEKSGGAAYASKDGELLTELQKAYRELGFHFFLLIRTLGKHSPSVLEICHARAKSYPFFDVNTGSIEIVRQDRSLEDVFFPVPLLFRYLTARSKERLEWEVDRTTPQKRTEDFVRRSEGMIHEMRHNERISHIPLLHMLCSVRNTVTLTMSVLSAAVNILILCFTHPDEDEEDGTPGAGYWRVQFHPAEAEGAVAIVGLLLIVVTALALIEHCISTLPLTLREAWEARGVIIDFPQIWPLKVTLERVHPDGEGDGSSGSTPERATNGDAKLLVEATHSRRESRNGGGGGASSYGDASEDEAEQKKLWGEVLLWTVPILIQQDRWLTYYLFYLTICVLGLAWLPFFFVITLLDIVVRSRLLQKVIEAVTVNSNSLALTFMLVAIVIYHFTVVGQLFFREDFGWTIKDAETGDSMTVDLCSSTSDCLMNAIYLGLSYEGFAQSLADNRNEWVDHPHKARLRWLVDLLFFIVVIVMLLNIIFGIVIDTFAQQRDMQNQIKDNMENVCFICGIDRNSFDRKHARGYEYHIKHEHNHWHYLAFLIHLRTKKQTDFTGPESYVADMLDKQDLSFFPILRTSSIVYEDQISNEALLNRIEELSEQVTADRDRLEGVIDANRDALNNAILDVRVSAHD